MCTRNLLEYKINVVGTVAISIVASTTILMLAKTVDNLFSPGQITTSTAPLTAGTTSVVECEDGLYSPVQRACVSKEIFYAEMQRLFSALGIDTSAYDARRSHE